jgi:hypothetical protein
MNASKHTLIERLFAPFIGGALLTPGVACAGLIVPVPSDISTTLTASPTTNLRPGQLINFTMTVTNHGPVPVTRLVITGSNVYEEFNPYAASNDCGLITAVVDLQITFYYYFSWYLTPPPPASANLAVGETRTCHFIQALTSRAPRVTPFSIGLPDFYVDPNPSNDRSTVYLVRALDPSNAGVIAE